MLHSFDVFDTLITRRTHSPQGIFVLMQRSLTADMTFFKIDEYIRNNFATLRLNAETLARQAYFRGLTEEITLSQIYDALALAGSLTQENIFTLMQLERETELSNVVGICENIEKVHRLIEKSERVICISDMYLDTATIRAMLVKVDPIFANVPLYVSSDCKFLKGRRLGDSNLFRYVSEQENASFSDWEHTGDNDYTDIFSSTVLGIQGVPYCPAPLRPYEKKIAERFAYSSDVALAIGAARNLRINKSADSVAALAGTSFAGPVLFSYVYWVLMSSVRRGFRRLYFIARDGSIPMKIADIIIEHLHLPIETHYIYGSRRAWRMPAYMGSSEELSEIFSLSCYDEVFTVKQFASIVGILEEELYAFFPEFGRISDISSLVYAEMKKRVCSSEEFCSYLFEKNREKRHLLREYLIQEVDSSDCNFAFVDIKGSGYTQLELVHLMKDKWEKPVFTFFFKMDKVYMDDCCKFLCFLPRFNCQDMLLEVMTRAQQEQTVDYCRKDGKITPVFSGEEGKLLQNYQYDAYEKGVLLFSRHYIEAIVENGIHPRLTLAESYLGELLNWTKCREFRYFAEMPFCNSGREENVRYFAPKLTDRQIDEIFLWNAETNPKRWYSGTSLEISLLRCMDDQKNKILQCRSNRKELLANLGKQDPFLVFPGHEAIPFALLGKQISIYGAGKYGIRLYQEAKEEGVNVVQWLDSNYKQLAAERIPVTGGMEDIGKVPYDCIILAILNLYLAKIIRNQLIDCGVPVEKIFCPVIEALSI